MVSVVFVQQSDYIASLHDLLGLEDPLKLVDGNLCVGHELRLELGTSAFFFIDAIDYGAKPLVLLVLRVNHVSDVLVLHYLRLVLSPGNDAVEQGRLTASVRADDKAVEEMALVCRRM